MRDRELYAKLLGVERPWTVKDVRVDEVAKAVEVQLGFEGDATCPECGAKSPQYDRRERRWRHLDTMQFKTVLIAEVPRIDCGDHGVRQVRVPWSEPGSRFTALFEAVVIDWLKEGSISGVASLMGLTWDEAAGIMARAVTRGLARRKLAPPRLLGVDETSFKKRHEYVTVVNSGGVVVHLADGRGTETLEGYLRSLSPAELAAIERITMDMWEGYIGAARAVLPDADRKIAFDRFHVAQHLGGAVDQVRREEHRSLKAAGDERLKGSRYLWLKDPENWSAAQRAAFVAFRGGALRTARAWALKEAAGDLWNYVNRYAAEDAWKRWYSWAIRSRLEPMKRVARMVKSHLPGILNAVVANVSNAAAEGINSAIQRVKYNARGFRNRDRFRSAIYFHLGGLDLYPASASRAVR